MIFNANPENYEKELELLGAMGDMELLYKNSSPNSSMPGNTNITLAHDNYDYLIPIFKNSTTGTCYKGSIVKKGQGIYETTGAFPSAGARIHFRALTYVNDTTYKTGANYWVGSSGGVFGVGDDNNAIIITEIYGFKA